MLTAYAYWSDDEQENSVSVWTSREACDVWRDSDAEARRRAAMAPYVLDEHEAFTGAEIFWCRPASTGPGVTEGSAG
jgi:hypothetical protein